MLAEFPRRETCDPNDPYEFALWAFVAMPGVRGAPLVMPADYWREMSKRLWDLGFRHVEEPTLEWVPPSASEPNWITSPGRWVPAGSGDQRSDEEKARDAVEKMTAQQRDELFGVLSAGEPFPDSPSGLVAQALSPRQREVVLRVLS